MTDADETITLTSLRGKNVVLFFYPEGRHAGLHRRKRARSAMRCRASRDSNAVILGISPDSPKSHRKFKEKFKLPYTLIADADHAIAERTACGARRRLWAGRTWVCLRTTFVIDAKGRIARVFEKVSPRSRQPRSRKPSPADAFPLAGMLRARQLPDLRARP